MKKVRDGYKMTELGEIPSEWEVKNIGEVAKFQGGYAFKSSDYVEDGIRLVKITNVQQKNISWNEEDLLPVKYLEKFNEYKLQEDDVVIAMTRPIISTGIKVCKIEKRDLPCLLNQRVGRFIIKDSLISKYLYNYCFTDYFINKVKELCSTTGQPNISANQIESILITIPSVKEQEKIAAILSTVDEQIDNVDALIEKNKELKKGLMQTLLTKGIGHTKFKKTEIGEIPEEWEVVTLGNISRNKGEYGIGASASEFIEGKARYLRITDIGDECNLLFNDIKGLNDNEYEKYLLSIGDVVFARTGNTTGKSYVYEENHGELVYAGFLIKFSINLDICKSNFIKYVIQTKRYWDWVAVMSTRSGQPGINSNEYSGFLVQLPPIEEQEKIASILSKVDKKIEEYKNKKQKLEELKKGLMQQLLTGMIRVIV